MDKERLYEQRNRFRDAGPWVDGLEVRRERVEISREERRRKVALGLEEGMRKWFGKVGKGR